MDTNGNLVRTKREESHDGGDRKCLIVNPGEAVDTRKPHAEEFVRPPFRFKYVKSQYLVDISILMLESRTTYGVIVNSVDHHLHQMDLVGFHLGFRIGKSPHCHFNLRLSVAFWTRKITYKC